MSTEATNRTPGTAKPTLERHEQDTREATDQPETLGVRPFMMDEQDNKTLYDRHKTDTLLPIGEGCPVPLTYKTENKLKLIRELREMWRGIKTPTGRDKQPPWMVVTSCPSCGHIGYTSGKQPRGMRFRCREYTYWEGSRQTVQCQAVVDLIVAEGKTLEQVEKLRQEWREDHG